MATNGGKKWYNDGTTNKMFVPGEELPGYMPGKIQKVTHTIKGKRQYNNGIETRFFGPNDVIPDGFTLGPMDSQIQRLKSIASNQRGISKSDATRSKLSESAKLRYSNPENHPMYGKHHTQETKDKLSKAALGRAPTVPKGFHYSFEKLEEFRRSKVERYGSIEEFNRISIDNSQKTKLERYGNPNYTNTEKRLATIDSIPEFYFNRNKKTRNTLIKKYGSIKAWRDHIESVAAHNKGYSNVSEYRKDWRASISNSFTTFTKLEMRFKEFLVSNGFKFETQYLIQSDTLQHSFDFAVFDGEGNLSVLVDCDGKYFHGYISDTTGKFVNPYTDEYRGQLVPDSVKFIIIVESDEESGYEEFCRCFNMSVSEYRKHIFDWCRSNGFPYPNYSDEILEKSYQSLIKSDVNKFSVSARYGEKVVSHFYPSIYHAHKLGKMSPYDAWQNDTTLNKCIDNRIIYKGNRLDPSKVLTGFSTSGIAPKVSVFNPYLAKYLISKYLPEFTEVFDPFSGFGGRLLGAASLDKKYVGQDINPTTVRESINMITSMNLKNCEVSLMDSILSTGKYECLLTCPPYSLKETWGQDIMNFTCDEWIDICISNFKCERYVFVVDSTEKYKDFIREELVYKSHFNSSTELVVVI